MRERKRERVGENQRGCQQMSQNDIVMSFASKCQRLVNTQRRRFMTVGPRRRCGEESAASAIMG